VIGSSGFLGSAITGAMKSAGIKNSKLSHQNLGPESSIFEIARPMIQDSSNFTHAIYLSWSTNRSYDFQEKSYVAAKYAADWAARNNVRIMFVSSMSAGVDSPRSNYGRFKKLAEEYYSNLGFQVVRPGTVLSKEISEGSALVHLLKLSRISRKVLTLFRPITLPIISVNAFTTDLLQIMFNASSTEPQNLVQGNTTVQLMLGLRTGWIPVNWIKIFLPLVPISARDKLQTLIDLN
jgi:hypothetical protein